MNRIHFLRLLLLTLSLAGGPLYARDVFEVTATTTDTGLSITVTAGSADFIQLIQDAIEANNQFAVLEERAATSVLDYGGVSNAMQFDINASGTRADLRIPSIGFQRTFIAANRDALYDQIKSFLQNEGQDVYRRFLEAMNRQSTIAVSDGNPNSTTANVANSIFENAGFGGEEEIGRALELENLNLSLMAGVGRFSTNNLRGNKYSLPFGYSIKINQQITTKLNGAVTYWEVEGAKIYDGNFIVNVPVKVFMAEPPSAATDAPRPWLSDLSWTVTPALGLAGGGSNDYGAGSLMYVGGLTSLLSYDFGQFTLTMGNHLSAMKAMSTDVGGYDVGGDLDQQILKNGIKLAMPFNGRWVGELYGIHTAFLQDAAISNFFTVGVRAGIRLPIAGAMGENGFIMVGAYGDIADDYTSFNVRIGSAFRF